MKRILLCGFIMASALPAQAQFLSNEALGGAALGGLAGGIIGHNSRGRTAEGAAIGAGAGLLLGALVHNAREERHYYATQAPVPAAPAYYSYAPAYYQPSRPNYAVAGTVVGGIAGGVIGHNSGGRTAEGVAIGAGAGLLLGGLAEHSARQRERSLYLAPAPVYYYPAAAPAAPAQAAADPAASASQPAPIINNYYGSGTASPMSSANGLFGR